MCDRPDEVAYRWDDFAHAGWRAKAHYDKHGAVDMVVLECKTNDSFQPWRAAVIERSRRTCRELSTSRPRRCSQSSHHGRRSANRVGPAKARANGWELEVQRSHFRRHSDRNRGVQGADAVAAHIHPSRVVRYQLSSGRASECALAAVNAMKTELPKRGGSQILRLLILVRDFRGRVLGRVPRRRHRVRADALGRGGQAIWRPGFAWGSISRVPRVVLPGNIGIRSMRCPSRTAPTTSSIVGMTSSARAGASTRTTTRDGAVDHAIPECKPTGCWRSAGRPSSSDRAGCRRPSLSQLRRSAGSHSHPRRSPRFGSGNNPARMIGNMFAQYSNVDGGSPPRSSFGATPTASRRHAHA